jgi:capsular exopolysaccharide synthesis family protein
VETRSQIIAQYLTAQAQNRLIAFTKEQEGKNKLLTSYLDAIIASRLAVFNQQSAARIQKLADLYAVDSKMERLLTDARALRSRLTVGASGSSQGNELAGLLLEASAFSTWSNLPVSLQIPIDRLSTGATPAEQLRSLDTLITALEDRRRRVRAEVDTQSQVLLGNSGYEFLDASMFGTDSVMQEVKKKYPELFVIGDLSQLTDNLDTNNPLAKAADERAKALLQLEGLEKVIAYSVTDEPLTKGVNQLHQEVNQLQARVEQENATKQELTRARDLAWSTYTTLSNKVAEASVAAQARGSVVRLAVPAITPQTPVGPRKTVNTLLGLVVGLMLGVGAAFLLEYTDDRISRTDQVTALLKLPMLGAIPQFKHPRARAKVSGNGREDKAILDTRSAAIESFRVLRYNLMANGATWRVLLIASAVPSEGKSTLAANLAALIANLGRSVTLVDGDMRRPSLHKIFDLPNDAGLSDLLSDSPDQIDAHAQATQVEGLRLISSGPLPTDPAALLESQAWTRLIEKLKTTSDVVVIDAPATLGLADTSIMARGADAILMVVERGKSTRRDALRAKEILTATEVPILGVAVNRAEEVPGASTYKYYARPEEGVSPSGDGQRAPEPSGDQARRKRSHGDASQWQMLRDRFVNLIVPR